MNIAVIFGGESCEHDISIITGEQLINNCNEYLYNVVPIYIGKDGKWLTDKNLRDIDTLKNNIQKGKECCFVPNDKHLYVRRGSRFVKWVEIDVAIVCLHGQRGEDGSVSGILELSKIPYSSSSMCGGAISMDKSITKLIAQGLGINTVEGMTIREDEFYLSESDFYNKILQISFPLIVKPCRQGSSIGIEVARNMDDLSECMKNAFKYDKKVLIEKFVDIDKEINIAIFKNKNEYIFSSTEEPVTTDEILSFDNKYRKNSGGFETIKRIMPANIDKEIEDKIKDFAKLFYINAEMFGVVRFDFILSKDGEIYLNEVNSIPGSMANYLFDKQVLNYPKLIDCIISNALLRLEEEKNLERVFNTDVLENDFNGFKK